MHLWSVALVMVAAAVVVHSIPTKFGGKNHYENEKDAGTKQASGKESASKKGVYAAIGQDWLSTGKKSSGGKKMGTVMSDGLTLARISEDDEHVHTMKPMEQISIERISSEETTTTTTTTTEEPIIETKLDSSIDRISSEDKKLDSSTKSKDDLVIEKFAEKKKVLEIKLAKYLKSKLKDTFGDSLKDFNFKSLKKVVSSYAEKAYNQFPDLTAAALQWGFPSVAGDKYQKFGRARVQSDGTCPHHANSTVACALQISSPKVRKILKKFFHV